VNSLDRYLYKKLFALKKKNTALWNGKWGARMIRVPNGLLSHVFSFVRQNEQDKIFAVFYFSDKLQEVTFKETLYYGRYTEYFSQDPIELRASSRLKLKPWDYRVFVK
jgi:hypothetical protein